MEAENKKTGVAHDEKLIKLVDELSDYCSKKEFSIVGGVQVGDGTCMVFGRGNVMAQAAILSGLLEDQPKVKAAFMLNELLNSI